MVIRRRDSSQQIKPGGFQPSGCDGLAEADRLDAEFKRSRKLRPLHGIPVIVKDNYDTKDLQTTGGSLALKGSIPPDDAYQVRRLREAGAIVLAKSNMAEWAFSPTPHRFRLLFSASSKPLRIATARSCR
jgi:Asp-tRNA(Asn)/Glu-tRNA(Gln) amidotransferase A subunit family amidase